MTEEVVVSYLVCVRCGKQGCHVEDNRGQGVISRRRLEQLNWCRCQKRKEGAVRSQETKVQQSGTWSGKPESTAREEGNKRKVRRTFQMLREVWLSIRIEKIDMHKGVTVKALCKGTLSEAPVTLQ